MHCGVLEMPVTIHKKAFRLSDSQVCRIKAFALKGGAIFNPDQKRIQRTIPTKNSIRKKIVNSLSELKISKGRKIGGVVTLHSQSNCLRQPMHYDYDPALLEGLDVLPLGVLIALEDGTRFETPGRTYCLAKGDILTFTGDTIHAGAAYARPNTRIHVYLDVNSIKRKLDTTWFETSSSTRNE